MRAPLIWKWFNRILRLTKHSVGRVYSPTDLPSDTEDGRVTPTLQNFRYLTNIGSLHNIEAGR